MNTVPSWNDLDISELRARGSFKWSLFPDKIGAFIAEMDFGVAQPVSDAASGLIRDGKLGYLPLPVAAELGKATSEYFARAYGWEVPGDWVTPLPDVLRAYEIAFTYFMAPDAPIVVPTPCYTPFLAIPPMHGRRVIEVPCLRDEAGVFRMDMDAIGAALTEGAILVLCNPHNPLGRVYTRDELEAVEALVTEKGARVFSDEIHAPLTYEGVRHIPYASLSEATAAHTLTATSASKAWNIPGLACAQFIASNEADAERLAQLGHFVTRGASNPGVIANITAYRDGSEWLDEVKDYLDGNRRHVAKVLETRLPGARYVMPEATYLAWIDLSGITERVDLAAYIREEAGVAVTGGEDCGAAGAGSFRLNFATPRAILDDALGRIVDLFA